MVRASEAELTSLLFDEQGAAPTTPATGFWKAYFKSDGLYVVDDAGTEIGPLGVGGGGSATFGNYTPTWTADSVNPTIGNGTLQGRFIRPAGTGAGSLVIATVNLAIGSTTNPGTGIWHFAAPTSVAGDFGVGTAWVFDSGGTTRGIAGVICASANDYFTLNMANSNSYVGHNQPFAWGDGDSLVFTATYEEGA